MASGQHQKAGKDVSAQVAAQQATTTQSPGTTAAEQKKKKSVAETMYPQRLGLRGKLVA